jgi:hypothetical protein
MTLSVLDTYGRCGPIGPAEDRPDSSYPDLEFAWPVEDIDLTMGDYVIARLTTAWAHVLVHRCHGEDVIEIMGWHTSPDLNCRFDNRPMSFGDQLCRQINLALNKDAILLHVEELRRSE